MFWLIAPLDGSVRSQVCWVRLTIALLVPYMPMIRALVRASVLRLEMSADASVQGLGLVGGLGDENPGDQG